MTIAICSIFLTDIFTVETDMSSYLNILNKSAQTWRISYFSLFVTFSGIFADELFTISTNDH